jgi:pimeloyl-ACP methyl ester carboxylesterase
MMFGEHDVTVTLQDAVTLLARRGGEFQFVIEPDSGHWVQYERAQRVTSAFEPGSASRALLAAPFI